jgi:hypothetical protein
VTVVLLSPTAYLVTLQNMNYAVVVAAGIAVFVLGWWWAEAGGACWGWEEVGG